MRNLHFISLSMALAVITVILAIFNGNNIAEFSMNLSNLVLEGIEPEHVSTSTLVIGFYFTGVVTGLLFMLQFVVKRGNSIRAYERKLEKTVISHDSSEAKIEVLENKIQVLEKALDDALRNK